MALATKLDWQLHHYNYQWWEYADDKIPPWPLMTKSPHGGDLPESHEDVDHDEENEDKDNDESL